ncbi:hypothetical protein AB664_03260 [Brucella anthropi]|uniref:Uncharacterized protein n=1 Tax=Brucella anthropi TaxID=529 RepID=A0A656Z6C1_BRUAN|nr:hypothetical protein AB664_03260 [Brucella anthropi]
MRRGGVANPVDGKPGLFDNPLRRFRVGAFPIGIDVSSFSGALLSASISSTIKRFQQSLEGRDLIVGVDRLDYTKGIPERLRGFRRFLEVNPAWHGRITMLQITPKSRSDVAEYDALQHEVAEIAGHINGAMPARLDAGALCQPCLWPTIAFGSLSHGQVGLVTPLRDGMNLVAKEYVAAQDPEDPGVLVLSRFAGAAHELGEGALLVNPYDVETIADALARARPCRLSSG